MKNLKIRHEMALKWPLNQLIDMKNWQTDFWPKKGMWEKIGIALVSAMNQYIDRPYHFDRMLKKNYSYSFYTLRFFLKNN